MKITSRDFARLRPALLLFVVFIALGAGAVFSAMKFAAGTKTASKQMLAQRDDIQSRLSRANVEQAEILKKIGRYQEIDAHGYIGREHRLEWVERIAQIKSARRLIDIQYELSPQAPLDAKVVPAGAPGGIDFMASTMRLQMQLLHEDDLLGFFEDLHSSVQAFLHVRECSVDRVAKSGAERGVGAQLKADCTIDWITLKEKS